MKQQLKAITGFPSSFAAFKYFEANAVGPVSWKLNGNPNPQLYDNPQGRLGELLKRRHSPKWKT